MDTVGWDDEQQDDTETFQTILRFLNRHNLTRLKAILWTVHPGTIRQDATLNKQAKLINLFAEKDVWDNVIIICKQAMNPEHEARGALNASYAFHSMSQVQVIGYRYLDDLAFKAEQIALFESQPSMRKDMNILDDAQVKALVTQKIRQIPHDIQIIFNNFRCSACSAEGDSRLLPLFCHMEKEDKHPGAFVKIHPKGTVGTYCAPLLLGFLMVSLTDCQRSIFQARKNITLQRRVSTSMRKAYDALCGINSFAEYSKRLINVAIADNRKLGAWKNGLAAKRHLIQRAVLSDINAVKWT